MLAREVAEQQGAFELLRTASQNTNRKLRLVADEIVETGDVTQLTTDHSSGPPPTLPRPS